MKPLQIREQKKTLKREEEMALTDKRKAFDFATGMTYLTNVTIKHMNAT